MEVGDLRNFPSALSLGRRPGTHCIGGWVGPRAGLGGVEKRKSGASQRLFRSESLYRLSFPGPQNACILFTKCRGRFDNPFLLPAES